MSLNKTVVTGQVAEVSEMRYTPANEPVANFILDLGNGSKLKMVCWRALAEKTKELQVGDTVLASGSLTTSSFKTPSGFTKKDLELNTRDIFIVKGELKNLNPIAASGGQGAYQSKAKVGVASASKSSGEEDLSDVLNSDEIPF